MTDVVNTARSSGKKGLWTTAGRESRPFKVRVTAAVSVVAALHLVGLGLLALNVLTAQAGAVTVGVAALAYFRGLVHSFDFDHISMIDNSTRKFVAEGRRPASVGLAFSSGHATVVLLTGLLAVSGAGVVQVAVNENSRVAHVLAVIGLSVSGLYLLLVACSNLAAFLAAARLRGLLRRDPQLVVSAADLTPRGPAARLLSAPLRRVRHPRHVYVVGFLFSLGFDTSSQMGLMVLTGIAAMAGAPAVSLLCLPFLFAAAMTLGDTSNGLMMLKLYETAVDQPARKITFNLLVTGVSILSAVTVAALAVATLLTTQGGLSVEVLQVVAGVHIEHAGFLLAGLFAAIGVVALLIGRRSSALATS